MRTPISNVNVKDDDGTDCVINGTGDFLHEKPGRVFVFIYDNVKWLCRMPVEGGLYKITCEEIDFKGEYGSQDFRCYVKGNELEFHMQEPQTVDVR